MKKLMDVIITHVQLFDYRNTHKLTHTQTHTYIETSKNTNENLKRPILVYTQSFV